MPLANINGLTNKCNIKCITTYPCNELCLEKSHYLQGDLKTNWDKIVVENYKRQEVQNGVARVHICQHVHTCTVDTYRGILNAELTDMHQVHNYHGKNTMYVAGNASK